MDGDDLQREADTAERASAAMDAKSEGLRMSVDVAEATRDLMALGRAASENRYVEQQHATTMERWRSLVDFLRTSNNEEHQRVLELIDHVFGESQDAEITRMISRLDGIGLLHDLVRAQAMWVPSPKDLINVCLPEYDPNDGLTVVFGELDPNEPLRAQRDLLAIFTEVERANPDARITIASCGSGGIAMAMPAAVASPATLERMRTQMDAIVNRSPWSRITSRSRPCA
jgi:hypothetical protein